jgi:probable F420-dependent oxidoreductase
MGIGVGLGMARFPFQETDNFWRWVELCEAGGVDSLWQTDRLVSEEPFLECMTALAAIAGATRRLKFGMNVASVALRDPLVLAKQCATIDFLSGGRLLPAFGIGADTAPEWAATGRETRGRGRRTDEALDIISRLWRGERVSTDGEHYRYREAVISPLPVQQPLPLWIGGSSAAAIRRTARFGTGWQAGLETPERAGRARRRILAALAETERSIDPEHFGTGFFVHFGSRDDAVCRRELARFRKAAPDADLSHLIAVGRKEILAIIAAYAEHGIAKFILRPLAEDDAQLLDHSRRLIEEVLPRVGEIPLGSP